MSCVNTEQNVDSCPFLPACLAQAMQRNETVVMMMVVEVVMVMIQTFGLILFECSTSLVYCPFTCDFVFV